MELVRIYDNVLDKQVCADIIHQFDNESKVYPGITRSGYFAEIKKTTDFSLNIDSNTSEAWKHIDDTLYTALNTALTRYVSDIVDCEQKYSWVKSVKDTGFLIQKYDKGGGYYHYHDDFNAIIDNNIIYYRRLTYLFYLNDVDEGGETQIWSHFKVQPRAGRLLFFPATWTYPHRGCMPISDDKYIATGWMYAPITPT